MPKVFTQYIKNVAKSTGYAINDIAHSMAPNFFEMKDDAKSVADDLYRQIKEFGGPSGEKSAIGKAKDTVNDVFKNMLEDISTGKFYNKERSEALMTDVAKSMGMDFDFDMDFGDDWGAGEDFDENDTSDENIIKADRRNTRDTIVAIDTVGARLSNEIGQATAASAKMVATANLNATRALYSLNQRGFNQVTEGIIAVNNSVTNLGAFMAPLSEHFQNSTKFFAETTKTLYNINENLTAILKNTTPSPEATANRHRQSKNTLASLMSGDAFSFSSYKDMVKGNITEALSMYSMIGDFLGPMLKSGKGGKNFSPMSMLFTAGIKHLIPTAFETAVKTLDQNLGHYIAGAMAKAASKNEKNYGLSGILASILLPKREYQETLSTKDYIKGKVAWDGKSRKALIEVIPTYLSKILATIQGSDNEYRYDYDSGKFVEYRDIKRAKEKDMLDRARSAFGVMYSDAASTIGSRNKKNAHMHDQLDKFIVESFRRGADYWDIMKDIYDIKAGDSAEIKRHNEKARKLRKNLGLTGKDEDVDLLLSILRDNLVETDRKGNKRIKSSYANVIGGVEIARNKMANSMKEMDMSGDSIYTNLYNNSYALGRNHGSKMSMAKGATDFGKLNAMYNEKVLNYLEGIYRFTGLFADNIDLLISGGGYKKNGKKKKAKRDRLTENINFNNPIKEDKDDDDEDESLKGLSPEELRARGNAEILSRRNNILNQSVGALSERYFGSNWKGAPRAGIQLLRAPFDAATNFLNEITNSFNSFLWGDPKGSEKGVFSRMIEKIDSGLDKLFEDGIGKTIKNGFKNFRDYLFGKENTPGFLNGFLTNTFNELKNAGRWVGNTAKAALYTPIFKNNNNGTAAEGRQVTKSGVVTVSEGEMIIPSEFNPYYHGKTNKAQQIANEKNIEAQYLGRYAGGSRGINDRKLYKEFYKSQSKKGRKNRQVRTGDLVTIREGKDRTATKYIYQKDKFVTTEGSIADIAKKKTVEIYNRASNIVSEAITRLSGFDQMTDEQKLNREISKEATKAIAKQVGAEAKKNNGAIGAGAAIGAVGSFLTGGILGPIGGAAIGAATGLIVRSQKVQDILFGKLGKDENGNETREGGLINKEMATFLQKHGVTIGKGAVLGGIGGTLMMGSPVAGIILGGATGFVKSSEEFQDKLFGSRDEHGNRIDNGTISFAMQDYIKKNAPKAIAGGLIGYLTKPVFGSPFLSMIFGSAIGLASSSERFKNFLLGQKGDDGKRHGGLIEDIRTKIFYNIDDIAHNTINRMKYFGKDLSMKIVDTIRNVTTSIGLRIASSMKGNRFGSWLLDRIEGVTSGVTNFVGNTLGRFNRNSKRRALNAGRSLYDRRVHRNMTAEERQKMRGIESDEEAIRGNNYTRADQAIASIMSRSDYDSVQAGISDLLKNKRNGASDDKRVLSRLSSRLGLGRDLTASQRDKIIKLIKSDNDISDEEINDILGIAPGGLDQDKMNTYKNYILEAKSEYGTRLDNNNTKKVSELLKQYGIDANKLSVKEMSHIQSLLKDEKVRFTDDKEKENKEVTFRDRMIGVATDISTNIAAITAAVTKTTPATDYTTQTKEAFKNENRVFRKDNGAIVKEVLGTEIEYSEKKGQELLKQQKYEDLAKYNRQFETDRYGIFKNNMLTPEQMESNKRVDHIVARAFGEGRLNENSTSEDYRRLFEENNMANDPWAQAYMQKELSSKARDAIDMRAKKYAMSNKRGTRSFFENLFGIPGRIKSKIAKRNNRDIERYRRLDDIERDLQDIHNEIISHPNIDPDDPRLAQLRDAQRSLWQERENIKKKLGISDIDTEGMTDTEELDYISNMGVRDSIFGGTHAFGFKGILSKGEAIVPGMNARQAARSASIQSGSAFVLESILDRQMENVITADKYVTHMASVMRGGNTPVPSYNGDISTGRKFIDSRANGMKVNSGDKDAGKTPETYVDFLTGIHQYERNSQGELVEQKNDRETDDARRRIDNFYNAILGMSGTNAAIMMMQPDMDSDLLSKILDAIKNGTNGSGGAGGILNTLAKIFGSIWLYRKLKNKGNNKKDKNKKDNKTEDEEEKNDNDNNTPEDGAVTGELPETVVVPEDEKEPEAETENEFGKNWILEPGTRPYSSPWFEQDPNYATNPYAVPTLSDNTNEALEKELDLGYRPYSGPNTTYDPSMATLSVPLTPHQDPGYKAAMEGEINLGTRPYSGPNVTQVIGSTAPYLGTSLTTPRVLSTTTNAGKTYYILDNGEYMAAADYNAKYYGMKQNTETATKNALLNLEGLYTELAQAYAMGDVTGASTILSTLVAGGYTIPEIASGVSSLIGTGGKYVSSIANFLTGLMSSGSGGAQLAYAAAGAAGAPSGFGEGFSFLKMFSPTGGTTSASDVAAAATTYSTTGGGASGGSEAVGAAAKATKLAKALQIAAAAAIIATIVFSVCAFYYDLFHFNIDSEDLIKSEINATSAAGYQVEFSSVREFQNYVTSNSKAKEFFTSHPLGASICASEKDTKYVLPFEVMKEAAQTFCNNEIYERARLRPNFDTVTISGQMLIAYKIEHRAIIGSLKRLSMIVVEDFVSFRSYSCGLYNEYMEESLKYYKEEWGDLQGVGVLSASLVNSFTDIANMVDQLFGGQGVYEKMRYTAVYFNYNRNVYKVDTLREGALSWDSDLFYGVSEYFRKEEPGYNAKVEYHDYANNDSYIDYKKSASDADAYQNVTITDAVDYGTAYRGSDRTKTYNYYGSDYTGKTDKVYVTFDDNGVTKHEIMSKTDYENLVSYIKNRDRKTNDNGEIPKIYQYDGNSYVWSDGKTTREPYRTDIPSTAKYLGYYSGVHHWDDGYTSTNYNRPNWTSGGASGIGGSKGYIADHPFSYVTNPKIKAMLQHGLNLNNKEWYSQDYRGDGKLHTGTKFGREVNQYCSDCSNFVGRMYKDHFGIDLGSYTVEQYENIRDGKVPGMTMMAHNQESRQEHLNDLQPGDVLFFRTKNARKGKADDVTHVELYAGNGKLMGQDGVGSGEFKDSQGTHGTGPTYRDFSSDMYSEKYFPKGMGSPYETVDTYDRFLGYARYTGGASGFVSQFDPVYSNKKVSGKSFAELGCGPAVASMAAAANGIDLSVDDAVRESRGYQDKYGVKSGYFDSVLAKRGLYTNYTKNPYDIYSKLAGGQSVIMLGSDPHNTSKVTSPYGPGNHYVLAKGLMGDKIVVNDPESNGTRLYDKSILANTRLGIATGSSGGRSFGNFVGGATASKEEVQKQVYAWLTSNGYSPAAAAGIMGNIKQESDFKPDDLTNEGAIAAGLFQWHDYTPYKTDPTDYKAMGRFGGVAKLAAANGRDWTDVETQLQYMNSELGSNEFKQWFDPKNATDKGIKQAGLSRSKGNGLGTFPNAGLDYYNDGITFDQFKALQDPVKAARYFEAAFERAGDTVNMDTRVKTAEEFYKKFADSTYTGNWQNTNYNPTTAIDQGTNSNFKKLSGLSGFTALNNFFFNGDMSIFGLNSYGTGTGGDGGYNSNGIPWIVSKQVTGSTTWVLLSNGESMTLDQYNERYLSSNGDLQTALVNCAKARINTEIYSMGRSGTDDYSSNRGLSIKDSSNPNLVRFSDCSYCMQKIYKDIAGVDIGYNTEDQISKAEKDDGAMFIVYNTKDDTKGAEKVLQPGDLVYFYGNNSHYKGVAHVEMYIGNGEMIGQNASGKHFEGYYTGNDGELHKGYKKGAGPTKKSFHRSKFLMATRLKGMKNYKIKSTLNGDPVVDGSNVEIVYYDRDLDKFVWSNGSKTSTTNLFESPDDVTHRKVGKDGKSQLHVVDDSAKGILWSDGNYIVRDKNYTDKTKKTEKVVITGYDKDTDTWTWNDGVVDRKPNGIQRKEYEERMHLAALSDDSGGSSKLFKSGKIFDMNKLAKKQTSGGSTITTRTISPTVDRTYRNLKKSINTSTPSSGGASKIATPTIVEKKTIGSIPTHSFKAPKTYSKSISGGASALTGIDVKNLEVLLLKLNETLTAIKGNTSVNPTLAASMMTFAAGTNAKIDSNTRAITNRIKADTQLKRDNEYNMAVANITSQLDSIING